MLYRGGKGGIITNPRKRNNDTLLFFGEFFRHGDSAEGLKAVELLNHIHSYFPITNNENLYTLATLVCEPVRMAKFLTGRNIFTEKELRGLYMFWRRMAELMNITKRGAGFAGAPFCMMLNNLLQITFPAKNF